MIVVTQHRLEKGRIGVSLDPPPPLNVFYLPLRSHGVQGSAITCVCLSQSGLCGRVRRAKARPELPAPSHERPRDADEGDCRCGYRPNSL